MKVILRRLALVIGALCVLLILVAAGGFVASQRRISRTYEIAAESIPIPTDSLSIERGRHLARAIAKCTDCHGENLAGRVILDDPALGRLASFNLTRGKGGVGGSLRDEDYVRAIRHGVGPDGHALLIMPSKEYQHLSAEDLGAIIAFAKSVPPVDNEPPRSKLGPLSRALFIAGKLPVLEVELVDHFSHAPAVAPDAAPTEAYGQYIVSVAGCAGCHGPTLAGGHIDAGNPSWPPASNLTPGGLTGYDEAAFFTALRTGVRPGGTKLKEPMPVEWTREMTDTEIRAVWSYLKTVPPREFGAR